MTLIEHLLLAIREHERTAAVADETALSRIEGIITNMATDLSKLQTDVAAAVSLIGTLKGQITTLQAAAAANAPDPSVQAAIDAMAASLEAAETPAPDAAPAVDPAPAT